MLLGAGAGARADEAAWVSPPMLDDVPIRAVEVAPVESLSAKPIVVPLPTGLETGAACLTALAAVRWWTKRRRGRRA